MSEGSSPDVYVRQLREIFLACDSSGTGLLNRDDLQRLCRRLNLESDISKRMTDSLCVATDDRRCVGFDQFKESFINVLTESEQPADDGDKTSGRLGSDGTENAIDLSEEERHLLGIWKELGVGANGNLSLNELHQVCQFLNMGHMTNKDVEQLFAKLDVDGDGFVSFGELLHGLFEIGEISHPEQLPDKPSALPVVRAGRMLSLPLQNSSDRRSVGAQSSQSLNAHEGILAFLNKEGSGFASSETIVELWESFGIREGQLILKLLRFDVKKSISLLDLSLALVDEIHAIEVDNNIVYQAALSTVEHALDYLHSVNEDLKLERNRLISDLSTMKKRNAAIVQEFDELYSSEEVKKTHEQRLASVEIEAKYQKVLIQLKQKSDECDQLQLNFNATKQEVASLVEKLSLTDKAKDALEMELFHMSEKCCSLEKEMEQKEANNQLQQQEKVKDTELSSTVVNDNNAMKKMSSAVDKERTDRLELENKELRDKLEAQTIYLSDLMHELSNEQRTLTSTEERKRDSPLNNEAGKGDAVTRDNYETELQTLMRGMSIERKDIEGVFRVEIAELEQRHLDQLSALKKELEKEKDELVSGHKHHLAEAVAERERDLLTEFAKEIAHYDYDDSAEFKELQERLRLAQEMAEERSRYAKELETRLSSLQSSWSPEEKSEERRPDAVQQLDEADEEEQMHSRDEQRLMQRLREEKQKMLEKFQQDLGTVRQEHEQELAQLNNNLTQEFRLERDKSQASFVDERRKLEEKITSMENDLQKKEEEKEQFKKDMEKELHKKDLERELSKKELEELLRRKEVEKDLYRTELERDLRKKEEKQELFKNDLEEELHKKELEKEMFRTELERGLRKKEEENQLIKDKLEELHKKQLENEVYTMELEQGLRKREEENQLIKDKLEELHKKELENEVYRTELERDLRKKEEENQLFKNKLEEELHKKQLEKELYRTELEKDLRKKEEEQELRKKELEEDLRRKEEENDFLRSEIEKLKRSNEKIQFQMKLKEEPSRERTDGYLKLQLDELRRNNVRLKDELEKRDGELLRLRLEVERSRQPNRDHRTGSGDHQLMTKTVAMTDLRDVLMERDLLKKQLQLTVKQLAEATSTLSLMSEELKKEKEMMTKFLGQVVERVKYDDVVMRLRDAEAKAHHLQHDYDFRATETTKLLSLSQTVNKQRLSHLNEENEKLEKQMKQRKKLMNDQLTKITKQAEELVKSDALIRDLYIENAHLVRCLQMTEGNRQDSDVKVQVLHQKCLDLGRLLHTVGPLAFNHR